MPRRRSLKRRLALFGAATLMLAPLALYWAPALLMRAWTREDPGLWPPTPAILPPLDALPAARVELASPDGMLRLTAAAGSDGMSYAVRRNGALVIASSRLGLTLPGDPERPFAARILHAAPTSRDVVWEQPWGEQREVHDRHNALALEIEEAAPTPRRYIIELRAFDAGIAIRYRVPGLHGLGGAQLVAGERTEFRLAGGEWSAWWIPAWGKARDEYLPTRTPLAVLGSVPLARAVQTPLTLQRADGLAIAIHEAALRNYPAMVLAPQPGSALRAQLVPWADGSGARVTPAFDTPWRTVQIADRAIGLIDPSLTLNLNAPPVAAQDPAIRPTKYIGVWWGYITRQWDRTPGDNYGSATARVRAYIDFAAANGFGGVLVESWNPGWEGWPAKGGAAFRFDRAAAGFDLAETGRYARSKGVELILHHETSGDLAHYEAQLPAALALLRRNGIHYVKTGYVAQQPGLIVRNHGQLTREWHYGQAMVDHEWRLAEAARRHGVAIIAHEAVKDTGMRRTYPNFLARESARGQEYNGFDAVNGGNPVGHETTLAFTRMLAGPMDYTAGIFDLDFSEMRGTPGLTHRWLIRSRVRSTLARQLALYVVLYSPVQMAADRIENYGREPAAFAFIRDVPTDWESSVPLAGEIGRYVVIARQQRGRSDWYLGALGDGTRRTLRQPLTFLAPGKRYRATIWADAPGTAWDKDGERYTVAQRTVTRGDALELRLAAGGGQAIRFEALPD